MAERDTRKRQVRCLNCFDRFAPPKGVDRMACPKCGIEWRLTWSSSDSVKIRGPVWSKVKSEAI
jgi:rRNA maturation endonuclease Nob1